jgi:Protein of unknown function (DUF4013)
VWFWDGEAWRWTVPPRADRPGLFWFFETPDWIGSFLLTGLIGLIPVVGAMVMLGWYLAARDNLRAGYWIVPPAGFRYLDRGAGIWVAQVVYGLALFVVLLALVFLGGLSLVLGAHAAVVWLLWPALLPVWLLGQLAIGFLSAAIISLADRYGIGAALTPNRVWPSALANAGASWRVFGAYLLGALIATGIGIVVPFGATLVLPAAFLMAAPAQAAFDETLGQGWPATPSGPAP